MTSDISFSAGLALVAVGVGFAVGQALGVAYGAASFMVAAGVLLAWASYFLAGGDAE